MIHLFTLLSYAHGTGQAIRRTGIVCTVGPESADVQTLVSIRKAGMNIVRLNFAHYSQEVCILLRICVALLIDRNVA